MAVSLTYNGFSIDVMFDAGVEREMLEESLADCRIALPLPHRVAWARAHPSKGSWFVVVRNGSGTPHAAFALEVALSRALPGYRLLRLERFGAAHSAEAREAALFAVAELARRSPRILRAYVEVFSPADSVRASIATTARALGYKESPRSRCYGDTLLVDLAPAESEILASLPKKTRRDIRAAAKHDVDVRPITDATFANRLATLLRETMARTGGAYKHRDWDGLIQLGRDWPSLSRLVGLFRADLSGPEALIAFAWGRHHGDHAEYATAATTRQPELRLPLGYPLVWDLICWAKRHGAQYLDLGGVSKGSLTDDDPLGGISDFKRYFSTNRVAVGAEWVLEPRPLHAIAANAISTTAALLSRFRRT